MALTVVKRPLSGSTGGLPMALTTATGTVIHMAASSTTVTDEVYIFAMLGNTQTSAPTISMVINSQSYSVLVPVDSVDLPILSGFPIIGNASASNGRRIEMYTNTASLSLRIYGYVNRVTES